MIEETRTNSALYSNDFTNAAWVKSNITAAKDQTGVDGASNGASSLLCSVANGTVLQSITLSSSARYQTCYVKRLVGTGTISMTMDGGTTWVDVTSQISSSWSRISIPTQTLANPQVGFKIATVNDKIAVQYFQNENGPFSTSPIPTVTNAIARAAESVTLTGSALTVAGAATGSAIVQTTLWEGAGDSVRYLLASSSSRALLYSNSNTIISSTTGTSLSSTIGSGGSFTGGPVRAGIAWSPSGRTVVANNGTPATDSINLSTGATVYLGGATSTPTFNGWVASMALYNTKLSNSALKVKTNVGAAY